MQPLVEITDGLLGTPDKVIMKARSPDLFPCYVQAYFEDKIKLTRNKIECGIDRVTVRTEDKKAIYDSDLFNYIKSLGKIECYLSNVPLQGDNELLFPLFAKYRFGWVVLAPLEV